jgi:nicotinate (nicotinamide) nucleotide adenylyltransferase
MKKNFFFLFFLFVDSPSLFAASKTCEELLTPLPNLHSHVLNESKALRYASNFEEQNLRSLNIPKDDLANFPLASLMMAPGHRDFSWEEILQHVKHMRNHDGGDFSHDPIIINVITNKQNRITDVDIWNGHHRLLAAIEAGLTKICDIKTRNIIILENGVTPQGEHWNHYLPKYALRDLYHDSYFSIQESFSIRPGTVSIPGHLSNRSLGSRSYARTVWQMSRQHYSTPSKAKPKVAIYFGTFDPVHEGHIKVAQKLLEKKIVDEVLFVPNKETLHKPTALPLVHRTAMLKQRLNSLNLHHGEVNLYLHPSNNEVPFSREAFLLHLQQVYAGSTLFLILGEDSAKTLYDLAQWPETPTFHTKKPFHNIVFTRTEQQIDPNFTTTLNLLHQQKMITLIQEKIPAISSTLIREQIKKGLIPPLDHLHPDIFLYYTNLTFK